MNQAKVNDNGSVDVFFYQDSSYMDEYSWFEQNNAAVDSISVMQNDPITLKLTGFTYMFGSYKKQDLIDWGY